MVLPAGFGLPPLPHLVGLLIAVGAVAGLLYRERPAVTEAVVLAWAPWMCLGAALHALYQVGAAPAAVVPLLGTPAVYLSAFAAGGAAWLAAGRLAPGQVPRTLAGVGTVALAPALLAALSVRPFHPWWPLAGLLAAVALTAGAWVGLSRLSPRVRIARRVGVLVVFAHALDGVSTAIGVDVLGFAERTPASRAIMDLAGMLPVADIVGVGWLFVLVKVAVAAIVVHLFADYVRRAPGEAYLLLGVISAVGLGPGVQNLLLYAVR